jgi:hypothetical protein
MYHFQFSKFTNIIGKIKKYLDNQTMIYGIHPKKNCEKYLSKKIVKIDSFKKHISNFSKKIMVRYVNYDAFYRSVKNGVTIIIVVITRKKM